MGFLEKALKPRSPEELRKINEEYEALISDGHLRRRKVEEVLGVLRGYGLDDVKLELGEMDDERVMRLWELLRPTFRAMCWRFGVMPPSKRAMFPELHQQILKVNAIQEKANGIKEDC